MQAMTLLDTLRVAYRPSRPPTAVYPDRQQAQDYRQHEFQPTSPGFERVFSINLEGGFFSPSTLKEMVLPVAQAIASGAHGAAVLVVVTSDVATGEYLQALAARHAVPFYLANSVQAPLSDAVPVGPLTSSELEALRILRRSGGEITSARMAEISGLEPNAAGNRLSSLAQKGYVHRIPRSRREGDAFVDLLSVVDHISSAGIPSANEPASKQEATSSVLPEGILSAAAAIAEAEGMDVSDVFARAWREYVDRHKARLSSESADVRRMLRENDKAGLAAYASRQAKHRATKAAARLKGTKDE